MRIYIVCLSPLNNTDLNFMFLYGCMYYYYYYIGDNHHDWRDDMTYQSMAQDVIHFLDTNHIEKVELIGHSVGGKVAQYVYFYDCHYDYFIVSYLHVDPYGMITLAPKDLGNSVEKTSIGVSHLTFYRFLGNRVSIF